MMASAKDGDGKPTLSFAAEQPQIRSDVADRILGTTVMVSDPTVVFTGGQPGAGKSRAIVGPLQAEYADKGGIGVIDPDEIRPLFAEARREISTGTAFSGDAYKASGTVAYEISIDVAKHQRNLLRDGTLADMYFPRQEMAQLRSMSYRVEAHVAAVYEDLSYARTVMRTEQQIDQSVDGFGRTVGREFHDKAVAGVASSVGEMWKKQNVDRLVLYDSSGTRVFEGVNKNGQWLDTSGRSLNNSDPQAQLEDRQHNPRPRDLVFAASTWMKARGYLEASDRKVPASPASVAAIAREAGQAYDKVLASSEALALACMDKPLRKVLNEHRDQPLQSAAEAWRKDSRQAAIHWPEHRTAFAAADRFVAAYQAKLKDGGSRASLDPKDVIVKKLATGQLQADLAKRVARETPASEKDRTGQSR